MATFKSTMTSGMRRQRCIIQYRERVHFQNMESFQKFTIFFAAYVQRPLDSLGKCPLKFQFDVSHTLRLHDVCVCVHLCVRNSIHALLSVAVTRAVVCPGIESKTSRIKRKHFCNFTVKNHSLLKHIRTVSDSFGCVFTQKSFSLQ